MADLLRFIEGSPESRAIQFQAFVIVRMAQAENDCPWYRVISRIRLRRGMREELDSFDRHETRVLEKVSP